MSTNQAVAEVLRQIARMQELMGADKFRAISNERAARAVEGLHVDVATIAEDKKALTAIDGIGPKIADKIAEFVRTGRIREYDELRQQVPAGLLAVMEIPGMGPKTAAVVWKSLGVTDLAGLKRAIEDGSMAELPRMGEKAVAKIKEAIAFYEAGHTRLHIGPAWDVAQRFVELLRKVKGLTRIEPAGSLRRGKETIGDIDIVVAAKDAKSAAAAMEAVKHAAGVVKVLLSGETKTSVRVALKPEAGRWAMEGKAGDAPEGEGDVGGVGGTVQVDVRVVPSASWGAALMYFTGSKEHNVRLRERAIRMGLTLNEYGLFPLDDEEEPPQKRGVKPTAGATEEEIYGVLGLPWLPPEVREDHGELELTESPRLVELDDIKAELHAHTTASDGEMSIEELAERAKARGFHTIAVTDHSKSSVIAGGLSVERLMAHVAAVRDANAKIKGITILAGSEVDILADGSLDYPDDVLAQLDVVVASPHTALSQDPEKATKRLLKAISNKYVNILGHPTGRLINGRSGLSPDMGKIIAAAVEHGVALEVNAHWMRLDLRDQHVRAAVEYGKREALIAIDCDVHHPADFDNLRFGVLTARRGWLTPERCVNTWSAKKLHAWLKARKG